jgi:hypothetical protein
MRGKVMIGANIIAGVIVGMDRRLRLGWGTRRKAQGRLESFISCCLRVGGGVH